MILVTGGTGLVGSHLLYFLIKEGANQVRATYRSNSDITSVKKVFGLYTTNVDVLFNKIEWVEANIIDIPALSLAFKNITNVYHCAAFINFDPSNYKILKKINVEGTANVVNLCLANKVKKICYVSSVSTLGNALNNNFITEETHYNPDDKNSVYAITKYGAEMEVWRGTQEGLNAVIVNPGVILGTSSRDGGSGMIIPIASSGIPFYPPGSMGIVDIQDVVKAMVLLMESETKNERFILVGQNITFKEVLSTLAPLFGKKPPSRQLSKGFMIFLSKVDWVLNAIFRIKRRVAKATVQSMFTTSMYDASKIKDRFGLEFISANDTLKRIANESRNSSN